MASCRGRAIAAPMESRALRTAKEIARHALHRLGLRRGAAHLAADTRAGRFEAIYANDVWRMGEAGVPASGRGSSLDATETLRVELPALLDRLGVTTLLDIGCGDFTWMAHTPLRQTYVGIDIVPSVIAANTAQHASDTRQFLLLDAVDEPLPPADAVLCREVLFHLSLDDARRLIGNMLKQPRAWFIATTDRATGFNADIVSGDFRLVNLEAAPFNLPPPAEAIADVGVTGGRRMGVWRAEQLRHLAR